ncbi:hypothetical protein KFE17_12000 [Faecalicatena sp. Marseille-Q4148]|nr:hypothetical protein KFE17_12000 [Faecalicatena sp. Marseille-Q4148]
MGFRAIKCPDKKIASAPPGFETKWTAACDAVKRKCSKSQLENMKIVKEPGTEDGKKR